MQQVLLIGGTGTISSSVMKLLSQNGDIQLYILNRGRNNADVPEHVATLQGDINDTAQVGELLKSYSFDSVCNFNLYTPQQARQNIELFAGKTQQFIHISTVAAYNHEISCLCREDTPFGNRFNAYGRMKAEVEQVLMDAFGAQAFPVTIVRPSQTYSGERIPLSVKGKGCWPVVSRMLRGKQVIIHGDGQSVWASTHADDFAVGFAGLVGSPASLGQAYQIINNQPHTWDMVYQELARLLGVEYRPVYIPSDVLMRSKKYDLLMSIQGDKRFSNIFDTSKIEAAVPDFKCSISIFEGLKRYLEYMEANPHRKLEEPDFDDWCDTTIERYQRAVGGIEIE